LEILQLTIAGVAIGCIYALIALGFVLTYEATEVVNFAQGDVVMLSAFAAFTFANLWHFPFLDRHAVRNRRSWRASVRCSTGSCCARSSGSRLSPSR
jgi:hypothetical protein